MLARGDSSLIELALNQTSYYKLFESDADEMFTFTIGFDTSNNGEADSFLVLYDVIESTSNGMTSDVLSFSEGNSATTLCEARTMQRPRAPRLTLMPSLDSTLTSTSDRLACSGDVR